MNGGITDSSIIKQHSLMMANLPITTFLPILVYEPILADSITHPSSIIMWSPIFRG